MENFHKNRLLKLAKFLKKIPKSKFNLSTFVKEHKPNKNYCNTVACACGWAGFMPEFRKRGFKTEERILVNFGKIKRDFDRISYNGYFDIEACKLFFGITSQEFDYLFQEYSIAYSKVEPTPEMVSQHIEYFVKTGRIDKVFNN